jgi:hypothetical protein
VNGPENDLKSELQITPTVETVQYQPTDYGAAANHADVGVYDDGDPMQLTFAGVTGDENLQETGGYPTPASEELHMRSEQDKATLEMTEHVERCTKPQTEVVRMPNGRKS